MKRNLMVLFLLFFFSISISKAYVSEDMKGVWVATVYNLDYPSSQTIDSKKLKEEATDILDNISKLGFNAVFLQVRPSADAFYDSDIFPWSKYLTGKNGNAPNNDFDPLEFWVDEAHKRGIELHAWINPYRITKNGDEEYKLISNESPAKKYPELVVKYSDGNYYFNPGIPEVRKLVVDGAVEIVRKYNVDGIHMDDYFYPGTNFDDETTYKMYGKEFSNIEDWRRNNVNLLVQELNNTLHKVDKDISFGISPFGIWRNTKSSSLGSNTNGNESYSSHYADTRKWVLNNWIDYIAPQIYWEIGHKSADYETLVNWWSDVCGNSQTKLYIGLADYRVEGAKSSSVWYKGKEIEKQLLMNGKIDNVLGEIHYRYSSLVNDKNIAEIVRKYYKNNDIVVFANGNKVDFDTKPILENGRTLVPMRAIFEALGAKVSWNSKEKIITAKRGNDIITLKIGSRMIDVNGKEKEIDVPAKITGSRTLVPLRAISEALDAKVNWNSGTRIILIKTNK